MVRGLLTAAAFLVAMIVLITLQPDMPEERSAQTKDNVTRAETGPLADLAEADPLQSLVDAAIASTAAGELSRPQEVSRPDRLPLEKPMAAQITAAEPAASQLTWAVLRNLDRATGRARTPGAEGSLLNVLITRALREASAVSSAPDRAYFEAIAREAARLGPQL